LEEHTHIHTYIIEIYLYKKNETKRENEREREIDMCFYCWLLIRWLLSSDTDDVDDRFEWFEGVDQGCKFCKAFNDALEKIKELFAELLALLLLLLLLLISWCVGDATFGLDESERWWWELVRMRRLAAWRSCSRSSAVCRRHFVRRFWNHV